MSSSLSQGSSSSSNNHNSNQTIFLQWLNEQVLVYPNNKEAQNRLQLRQEASTFFSSLTPSISSHEQALALLIQCLQPAFAAAAAAAAVVVDTSSNDNKSSPIHARLAALECLSGALEACSGHDVGLSPAVLELLGTFLLQQIGPLDLKNEQMQDVNDMNDLEQEVRDASLQAMTLLIQTASTSPQGTTARSKTMISLICRLSQSAVQRRCAQDDNDDDEQQQQQSRYGGASSSLSSPPVTLSTLPRSKRSMCFELLRAAVDSLAANILLLSTSTPKQQQPDDAAALQDFPLFCVSSLVGESDPRCLLQLLRLLSALQEALSSACTAFDDASSTAVAAVIVPALFNAVAPYYPIQFTPPPNNVHGITKQALQDALWNVLSFTKLDNHHDHDAGNKKNSNRHSPTMFSLTLGIVLERLLPPEPDPPASPDEQLAALDDLTSLLQLSSSLSSGKNEKKNESSSARRTATSRSRLDWMEDTSLQQVSDTLRAIHDRASLNVAKASASAQGDDEETTMSSTTRRNKQVADACRTAVSRIAWECEQSTSSDQHWQVFVGNVVQQLQGKLLLLGNYASRAAIAYMACLAGCGGVKTLNQVLTCGLHPLLDIVMTSSSSSSPGSAVAAKGASSVAVACSGIAAFLVSTQVTVSKMQQQGIVLTPHPLQAHAARMVDAFSGIIILESHRRHDSDSSTVDIRVAAVHAMEAVLLTVPARVLLRRNEHDSDAVQSNSGETTTIEKIVQSIQVLTDTVVIANTNNDEATTPQDDNDNGDDKKKTAEWSRACAETLGRLLAYTFQNDKKISEGDAGDADSDSPSKNVENVLTENKTVRIFLVDSILPALLQSASTTRHCGYRYDRMTLAVMASCNCSAAVHVLQPLFENMYELVQKKNHQQDEDAYAQTIASILSNAHGPSTAMAFQQEVISTILLDMIKTLAEPQAMLSTREGGMEASFGMSTLKLPPTEEDEAQMQEHIQRGQDLLLPMLPVYDFATSIIPLHREQLCKAVAKVLPPLKASDTVRLSLTLPFLAAALQHDDSSKIAMETGSAPLSTITADLADFALYGNALSAPSRSYAAVCLHAILVRMDSTKDCPCFDLMKTVVAPLVHSSMEQIRNSSSSISSSLYEKDLRGVILKCKEALSMAGLLGSAAACRGGSSAKTADKLVTFLIDLACRMESENVFSNTDDASTTTTTVDLTVFDQRQEGASTDLAISAASAFGSILSCGGTDALWKQRTRFIAYKRLQSNITKDAATSGSSIGAVCVSSHLICSTSNLSTLPTSKNGSSTELLAAIVLDSLSPPTGADSTKTSSQCILPTLVKKLVLTSIIKLLCVAPASMTPNLYLIMVGVMRAYASNVPDDSHSSLAVAEQDDTVCKVLALQALETVATIPGAPKDMLGAVKPAVVAILEAAMNEKSSVLRQAGVDVRNIWAAV